MYSFKEGRYEGLLKNIIKREIEESSPYVFKLLSNINFKKIESSKSEFLYEYGDDLYYMFAYKGSYNSVRWSSLPKYHVCKCKTRIAYDGYFYANQMPITFYDTGLNKNRVESLDLCGNCKGDRLKAIFGLSSKTNNWYDYVIDKSSSLKGEKKDLRPDGYIRLWAQLSEAIRTKNSYCCASCKVNLNDDDKRMFLDVHHINGNKKDNKESNLKPLCVLCHASHHENNFMQFEASRFRLSSYIQFCSDLIPESNDVLLNKWKANLNLS